MTRPAYTPRQFAASIFFGSILGAPMIYIKALNIPNVLTTRPVVGIAHAEAIGRVSRAVLVDRSGVRHTCDSGICRVTSKELPAGSPASGLINSDGVLVELTIRDATLFDVSKFSRSRSWHFGFIFALLLIAAISAKYAFIQGRK